MATGYGAVRTTRLDFQLDGTGMADWHMTRRPFSARFSRVINEVKGVNRVCYDISIKPPSTIDWE